MYFVLSKVIGFLALPSNAIAVLCVIGMTLTASRFRRAGLAIAACGVALLAVIGWSPVAQWLMLPLSERFPAWQAREQPAGIIILGGGLDADSSVARNMVELDASGDRILVMLQLARRYPAARIVYSGGSSNLVMEAVAEAPIAGRLLDEFGLGHGRVILESRSRTTEENAIFTRDLVAPKPGERWLLVTSAFHMPRSVGLYRKAGFEVEAYPVDFRSRGWRDAGTPFERINFGLARADVAVHEWIGLFAAWLNRRSDDLFPGPRGR